MADVAEVNNPSAFEKFLAGLPEKVAALVAAADEAVRSVDPTVTQVLWPHQRTVGYGIGPRKMSEHYAYLDVYDRHINLGFNYGATLPDPAGLLGGTGKNFRSMRITDPEQLRRQEVLELLRDAVNERREQRKTVST
jgi:hypothetical protein